MSTPFSEEVSAESPAMLQSGVAKAEAISKTWTQKWLIIAYCCIIAMACSTSFGEQVSLLLTAFATSTFQHHSMLATIAVIGSVLNAVFQPPVAKIADVFGRQQGFLLSLSLYMLGYTLAAVSRNIETYAAAKVFEAAGIAGLKMMQQVFIADTSDLRNRMIMGSLPDVPFIVTVWAAPAVSEGLRGSGVEGWRWGYGIWAMATPCFCGPFIAVLWWHQRKSGEVFATGVGRKGVWEKMRGVAMDLDLLGTVCLTAGFAFVLVPLTIAASTPDNWRNSGIVASLVVGGVLLLVFPWLQRSQRLCPTPLLPRRLLKNPSIIAGMCVAFFYFMAFFLSIQPYFYSYMIVTRKMDPKIAGYIMNTFSVSCSITVVAVGFMTKYSRRWKPFLYTGIVLYTLGIGLMLRFRNTEATVTAIVLTQLLVGIGGGFINGPAQLGLQASCKHSEVASATALFLTTLSLGGAVGGAVSGAVWTAGIKSGLQRYLPVEMLGDVELLFGDMTKAAALEGPGKVAVDRAYEETMHRLIWIAFGACVPMVPAAWAMRDVSLEGAKDGQVVVGNMKGKPEVSMVQVDPGMSLKCEKVVVYDF